MHPADILKQNYPPSILIYGEPGTSKTALISQLSNAFVFDFDKGMRTAATLKDKFFDARQKITFETFRDENPLKPDGFMKAMKKIMEIRELVANNVWQYDACVLDSLTGLCSSIILQNQLEKKNDPFHERSVETYKSEIAKVERFLTIMRSLKVLTVVTAHLTIQQKTKDRKFGEMEIVAMHPKSITKPHGHEDLQWLFDEVWFADVRPAGQGKLNYRVSSDRTETRISRTRSGFGTVIHNEIGMVGLLRKIGYEYGKRASGTETLVGLEKTSK